jgi:hypothetical protein
MLNVFLLLHEIPCYEIIPNLVCCYLLHEISCYEMILDLMYCCMKSIATK